jgi:hypothetical protein
MIGMPKLRKSGDGQNPNQNFKEGNNLKTRKLMAILVMVAMIVTALPMVAFAADEDPNPNRFQSDFEVKQNHTKNR